MNKKKILIYSDCSLFGGSEYVVVNILKDKVLNDIYDFYFAYRKHNDYQEQIDKLFTAEERLKFYPLSIWAVDDVLIKINKISNSSLIRKLLKLLFVVASYLQIFNLVNYLILKRFIKKVDVDLVHINNGGYPAAESCLVLAKVVHEAGIKALMQINNIPSHKKKYWDSTIRKSIDSYIVASRFTTKEIDNRRKITRNNVYTLRDNVKLVHPTMNSYDMRKKLGIAEDAIILIQVALLLRYKGQIHILQALNVIRTQNKEFFERVVLILIGSGEMEQELIEYIKKHNLENKVKLLGYRNDYINYVNMADIMVHPSRENEDMPLIILSAMSLGKPTISCNFAGIPEEIDHLSTGLLLDPNSNLFVEELSEAIQVTYKNREEWGEKAKQKFESEFSESNYRKGLIKIYNQTLGII